MLLRFCMLITLFMGAASQYNYRYFCPNTSTYTPITSTFEENRKFLLYTLSSKGNFENGFYNFTAGGGGDPDTLYGMFMCRGDVSTGDCATCIYQACSDILRVCPAQKTAIIWFDHCMLRFSDEYIFQKLDKSVRLNMSATEKDPQPGFMQQTLKEMIRQQSGKRFVTHESPIISGSKRVYSLGQCTPDLSESDCQTCLKNSVQLLHTCCDSALGARVLSPSCYVRYEIYPFYTNKTTAPAPPPTSGNNGNSSTKLIIAIVVPVAGVILSVVFYFLRIRGAKKGNTTIPTTIDMTGVSAEESSQYDFAIIQAITNDFSHKSKIGEGGYGSVYKAWEHWRDGCQIKILDPSLGESYTVNEVIPCIHIGLLCVQDNADERPTMTKVMLMLDSYFSKSWPTPSEPAFYRSESKRIPKEIELALSTTVNEVSISELCPR
nr:cysteine-rich receptor-like protein kinase 25 [Ipomoea trifida]